MSKATRIFLYSAASMFVIAGTVLFVPLLVLHTFETMGTHTHIEGEFPVTVDPKSKTIVESDVVDAFFSNAKSPLVASVGEAFVLIAAALQTAPWYQALAAADSRLVVVRAGMRKEQVAKAFAEALGWSDAELASFLRPRAGAALPLVEGSFAPGVYEIPLATSPEAAQAMVNARFENDVLSHYGTTTAAVVPLIEALTLASLIEREAGGESDMRLISGILWNRRFINMPLQVDATLQYAKASTQPSSAWWPQPLPKDRYIASPYNTYLHTGLPPAPIASPSVASILAALNPKKTPCLYYFHDSHQGFHCSETYQEHVALIKKYYGRTR